MLTLTLAALLAAPALATTTLSLDSGWAYGSVGYDGCGGAEDGSVSAVASFTSSGATIANVTGIHVDIAGMHGGCATTISGAILYLDSTAIWSQSIGASGSGLDCCEWYIDLDYSPSSVTDRVLASGSHSLTLVVSGTVEEWGEQIAARISATVEHGTDWDSDGYDATAVGGTDCDDDDASVNPSAAEIFYDGTDQDCDGSSDYDADADGYDSSGYGGADCDDSSAAVSPAASELCNGIDDDCDGSVDEPDASDATTWYLDSDGDGHGVSTGTATACSQPSGYAATATDCDDSSAAVSPDAAELCNGIDDDCDGAVDEDAASDATTWYADSDGDGYGDPASSASACTAPSGHVASATDCDDGDPAVSPGASELCNGIDDDCDGRVDEDDAVDASTWYADTDGDGHAGTTTTTACDQPSGYEATATDCDDGDAAVNPDAEEIFYDGVDQDCDGGSDYDADGDGWDHSAYGGDDCDDDDPLANPDAEERWYDGVDSDCDGGSDYDMDGDGHDSASYGGDDCDDDDEATYPGAPDEPYDGVINDCDASDEFDQDGDGHDAVAHGGDDCDDASSGVNPSQDEIWYDGVDQDCDGNDDDQDGDGWGLDTDCDDTDPSVNPTADEIWYDGVDQDCDGNDDDQDGDGWGLDTDCDDTDPSSYPGAAGLDEDCEPIDTAQPDDTDRGPGDSEPPGPSYRGGGGCTGCAGARGSWPQGWLALLALVGLRRRRPDGALPSPLSSPRAPGPGGP
jgi:hypothetical protein